MVKIHRLTMNTLWANKLWSMYQLGILSLRIECNTNQQVLHSLCASVLNGAAINHRSLNNLHGTLYADILFMANNALVVAYMHKAYRSQFICICLQAVT